MTPEQRDREFSKRATLLDAEWQSGIAELIAPRIMELFDKAMASSRKVKPLGPLGKLRLRPGKIEGQFLFNGGKNILLRMLTPRRTFDIDQIRCCPRRFSWLLDDLMKDYLNKLRAYSMRGMPGVRLTHAACPMVSIARTAYMVDVFLWGHFGVSRPTGKITRAKIRKTAAARKPAAAPCPRRPFADPLGAWR